MTKTSLGKIELFINKFVKIVYEDDGKYSVARGILKDVDRDYILIEGNLSEICIATSSVRKISSQIRQGDSSASNKRC